MICVKIWGSAVTHILDPYGKTAGNYRTAPERMFPIVFAASFFAEVVTWV